MGLYVDTIPPQTHINWLYQLAAEKGNVDFSFHISPSDTGEEIKDLNRELLNITYDINASPKEEPHLVQKAEEVRKKITELSAMQYKLSTCDLYFTAKALSPEKAETLAKSVKSNLSSGVIDSRYATGYQQPLLKSVMPFGENFLKTKQLSISSDALAESDPFSFPWLDIDEEDGVLLCWNENGLPIAKSLWKLPSYSGVFMGPSGSGKSFAAKAFLDQENMANGTQIIIIDPAATKGQEPEYKRMCKKKGGTYISFSDESKNIPNILSLYGDSFRSAKIDVASLLSVLLGDKEKGRVTDAQIPLLEEALNKTYEAAGVTENKSTWSKVSTLDMLFNILKKELKSAESPKTKESYEALIKRLKRFIGRGNFSFINTKGSELKLDKNFTVFEFQDTHEDIKPVMTGIVANYIRDKAASTLKKTLIVIDEAHYWLSNPVLSDYILRLIKTLRKTNTGVILIFQNISDLENCKEGLGVLGNIEFKYIMGCKPNELRLLGERLDLNDIELNYISTSGKGVGVLIWGNDHYRMRVHVDDETYELITTNPEDITKYREEEMKSGIFDEKTLVYLKEDIKRIPSTMEECADLLSQKIIDGKLDKWIVNHYHHPLDNMIKERLDKTEGRIVSQYHRVDEKLIDKIATGIHKHFLKIKSKKVSKLKKKKHGTKNAKKKYAKKSKRKR